LRSASKLICSADPLAGEIGDERMIVPRSSLITSMFSLLTLSLLGCAMYFLRYHDYILVGDEPAVISETLHQSVSQWFSEGFSKYFIVYPEWFTPITNFSRPLMNLIPYANYLLFSNNFQFYYLPFYALQFSAALVFAYFMRIAHVPSNMALLFLLMFLMNPAFINYGLVMIPYQFDVIASIFLLFAFLALWKESYTWTMVMLFFAVFTKETALFGAIAAAMTVVVWKRRAGIAFAFLLPLIIWGVLRWVAYGTITGANYSVAPGLWGTIVALVKGLVVWPSGIIPGAGGLLNLFKGEITLPTKVFYGVVIGLNGLLWAYIAYLGLNIARRLFTGTRFARDADEGSRLIVGLFIWTLGALSFCVLLGLSDSRYGASVYVFLLLLLSVTLFGNTPLRPAPWISGSITVLMLIACAWSVARFFAVDSPSFAAGVDRQRALYYALRSLSHGDGSPVYVVNAPGELGSSPTFLRKAWHVSPDVVFINQTAGCPGSPEVTQTGVKISSGGTLTVVIPHCMSYKFANADDQLLARGVVRELDRPGVGIYSFPHGRIEGHWFNDPDTPKLNFGNVMQVRLYDPQATILAYDWSDRRYTVLSRSLSESVNP
jgi:hypothetical protein